MKARVSLTVRAVLVNNWIALLATADDTISVLAWYSSLSANISEHGRPWAHC